MMRRQFFGCNSRVSSSILGNRTLDQPLAVAVDRVVSGPVCDITRRAPQHLPVALAVPCMASRRPDQQHDHHNEGDREGGGHHWHRLNREKISGNHSKTKILSTRMMQEEKRGTSLYAKIWFKLLMCCKGTKMLQVYKSNMHRKPWEPFEFPLCLPRQLI